MNIEIVSELIENSNNCVFLDSADSTAADACSYLFVEPIKILTAFGKDELNNLLNEIESLRNKYYVVGYLTYEASYYLEKRFQSFINDEKSLLAWFGVYENPYVFNQENEYCNSEELCDQSQIINVIFNKKYHKNSYVKSINRIKDYIKAGDTYQINFTYDNSLICKVNNFELYKYLRRNQKTSYCAFIKNDYHCIASFSPELFFKVETNSITVKPMKGTAPRGVSFIEDEERKLNLQNGEKDRAENLMIVDLLRNDLGRICKGGTVKVEKLFEVETHPTVHQMTSTISGELSNHITFGKIIRSIFPCGSVTGAPKIRAMEIIHELEEGQRGVYCGAIGLCTPRGKMEFNVPIRTLVKKKASEEWNYRVGSGIVWDSDIEGEWQECDDKTAFLTENPLNRFDIVETIKVEDKKLLFFDEHLKRMELSALYFGFLWNKSFVIDSIKKSVEAIDDNEFIIRVLLKNRGEIECQILPFYDSMNFKVGISKEPVNSKNVFLYHKTTNRAWYKDAMERIKKGELYDIIYKNERGEITEGARSNLFVEIDKKLYTPKISSGLLPGILREDYLNSKKCFEKDLFINDLENADAIYCGNSVRGLVKVELIK